jgi:uncharacterized protein with PIN domain
MTVYLDTSHLVKLYLDEPGAADVKAIIAEADVVATSVLTYPEARATIARRRRERLMTAAECQTALRQLDADWSRFVVMILDDELGRAAGHLAEEHAIRGGDAVHLAAFERLLSQTEHEDVRFSCADDRLVRAARRLG